MFSRILSWINERWPLSPFIRLALEEEMSGGAGYAYVFGSAALIIFLLQVVTGIWQLFYYVPTLAQGYNSLNYLRTEVPFGWLVHGLHYWGANAMVVLVLLHISQVFIWGAYKKPHELQWVTGVFLFLLTMAMSLTGGALPWDKRSYWLVEVASSSRRDGSRHRRSDQADDAGRRRHRPVDALPLFHPSCRHPCRGAL